ncbi:MAG: Lnb N-terminal periplasmic domain-containing protein [Longimicrobiales bacterium]
MNPEPTSFGRKGLALLRRCLPSLGASSVAAFIAASPCLQAQEADGPAEEPGASLSVYLLTAEPGNQIWELFGHNAILIQDTESDYEKVFHYGLFSFSEPGFIPKFLRGEMMYWAGAGSLDPFLQSYERANRKIWAQELNLSPNQKARLYVALETAVLPENRTYLYQYFTNNCSTRLRDDINGIISDELRLATAPDTAGVTWRTHTARLTKPSALGYLGIQLMLGPKGDNLTSRWDEMWVPGKLREEVSTLTYRQGGEELPLMLSEELWTGSDRESEATAPPRRHLAFLGVGLVLGLLILGAGKGAASGSMLLKLGGVLLFGGWEVLCFLLGALFIVVHFTDHTFMYWNQNVLLFTPLGLGLALLIPAALLRGHSGPWVRRLATGALLFAAVALVLWLLPPTRQGNGEWVLFALPVHAALWWVVTRVFPATPLPELT